MKTTFGEIFHDLSGLWHYKSRPGCDLLDAATDAVNYRSKGPIWFWFDRTPVPIDVNNPQRLASNWSKWRDVWLANGGMLVHFAEYSGMAARM